MSPDIKSLVLKQSPDIEKANDLDFTRLTLGVLKSLFNYRSKLTVDQMFKYGLAELKMTLCVDTLV